jgi:hypothetical protein
MKTFISSQEVLEEEEIEFPDEEMEFLDEEENEEETI